MAANNTNPVEQEDIPLSTFIPATIVQVTECLAIVILNFLAIVVFTNKYFKNRQTTYLIINLAIVDLLVGALTGPLLYPWDRKFPRKMDGNKWKFYMDVVASGLFPVMSLLILAALSLERVHATFYPIKHRMVRKRVYHVVIAVLWILATLTNVIIIAVQEKRLASAGVGNTREKARHSFLIASCLICLICLIIVGSAYFSIFIKMRYGQQPLQRFRTFREKRLTITLFIVTVVSFLTWLPLLIRFLVAATTSLGEPDFLLIYAFRFLAGVNSLVNPILYVFRVKKFRIILRHHLKKIAFRGSVQELAMERTTPPQQTPHRITPLVL